MKIYGNMNFWAENEVDTRLIQIYRQVLSISGTNEKKNYKANWMIDEFTHINFRRIISIKILKGCKKNVWNEREKNESRLKRVLYILMWDMNDGWLEAFFPSFCQINC